LQCSEAQKISDNLEWESLGTRQEPPRLRRLLFSMMNNPRRRFGSRVWRFRLPNGLFSFPLVELTRFPALSSAMNLSIFFTRTHLVSMMSLNLLLDGSRDERKLKTKTRCRRREDFVLVARFGALRRRSGRELELACCN
jgi:hypothetical protein